MSDMRGRLAASTAWISISRVAVAAVAFVGMVLLARLLDPEDFGLVAFAAAMIAIVSAITEMSLSDAIVHLSQPERRHLDTAWTFGILRGAAVSLVTIALAYPVAWIYGDARLPPILFVLAGSFFLVSLQNPRLALLKKNLVFAQDTMITVAGSAATFVTGLTIALVWRSYWALVIGTLAGQLVSLVLGYVLAPYRPSLTFSEGRTLWSFSLWMMLSQGTNTLNWRFDQFMVGSILGNAALGLYAVGDRLAGVASREAVAPLKTALYPAFTHMASDPRRLRNAYRDSQTLITFVALPVGIGFALIAEPLVGLTMGKDWARAVPLIQALSGVIALQSLGACVQPLGMALGRTRLLFNRSLMILAFRIPVLLVGMLLYGLPGLIIARVITGIASVLIDMALVKSLIGAALAQQLGQNSRGIIATAVMAICVLALQHTVFDASGTDAADHIAVLAGSLLVGCFAYSAAIALQWLMVNRPRGPETELLGMVQAFARRIRRSA